MFCSLHLAMSESIHGSNHEQRIIEASYRMDSAIAPDRHSASAERVDSPSVLVAKVSCTSNLNGLGACHDHWHAARISRLLNSEKGLEA